MKSTTSQYFSRLDHLRLLAALMVLFWHVMRYFKQVPSAEVPAFWPLSFAQEGHTGVALFMVLSGYIFQQLCRNREVEYFGFIRNRLLRIAPLFIFWTLLFFYIGDVDPVKLFIGIFGLLNKGTVPGVGWTIIVEFQFYLLFPFLLFFTRKYGLSYPIGLVLLALFFRWGIWYTVGTVQDLSYATIFGRIDQFLLGMIGCELANRHKQLFSSRILLLGLIVLWLAIFHRFDILGGYFDNKNGYPSSTSVWIYWPFLEGLFYSLITASYLGIDQLLPKFVDKILAWLGTLSYSFYLNHYLAIQISFKAFKWAGVETAGFWNAFSLTLLGAFPLMVIMSVMTYYLIEQPFLLLRKPYLKPFSGSNEVNSQLPTIAASTRSIYEGVTAGNRLPESGRG